MKLRVGLAFLAGSILAACDGAYAKQICHTASAPAQLFVDSMNAVWFPGGADGSHQITRVRFPCQIKTIDVGDVHPNAFAENTSGLWFTEYLGKNINGKWLDQIGHVDRQLGLHQVSLGRVSTSPSHSGGIVVRGDDLWIAQPQVLVRYNISTHQTTRFYAKNPSAVLLGPILVGGDLWFVDANGMALVAFNIPQGKFGAPIAHPAVNSGQPTSDGSFLYYADWNTGRVTGFDTRTHERRNVDHLTGVNTLRFGGNCKIAAQGSKVNVYTPSMHLVATYDENKGLSLPGGLAVNRKYVYFSTFTGIIQEPLPDECS